MMMMIISSSSSSSSITVLLIRCLFLSLYILMENKAFQSRNDSLGR